MVRFLSSAPPGFRHVSLHSETAGCELGALCFQCCQASQRKAGSHGYSVLSLGEVLWFEGKGPGLGLRTITSSVVLLLFTCTLKKPLKNDNEGRPDTQTLRSSATLICSLQASPVVRTTSTQYTCFELQLEPSHAPSHLGHRAFDITGCELGNG